MDTAKIIELVSYTLPAIVTGLIALYFFKLHTDNDQKRRIFLLKKENQKLALPTRLQAYERMTLFLERISPNSLLVRVTPTGNDKTAYFKKLLTVVEQEFEHNLAQQIYVTPECWNAIITAKNKTLNMLRDTMLQGEIKDANTMREAVLQQNMEDEPATKIALEFLKSEVKTIF
ncbi:MAG: hypothetical protein R2821_04605 [Flavobacteriaceae bacterium]